MATRGRPRGSASGEETAGAVQALDRAMRLMEAIAAVDGITLTALAERADLAPSTVHRLLATLARHGWVESAPADQTWAIGVEAFRIGQAFQRRQKAAVVGRPMMRALMEETGETVNLGLFEGGEVVFVAQVESHSSIRAFFRAGERRAAHASGIGKALLATMPRAAVERVIATRPLERYTGTTIVDAPTLFAELERIRDRGFAVDDEERTEGMRCIAAPIFDENGEAVAGISISGPSQRLDRARAEALGPAVARTAAAITAAIGGRPAFGHPATKVSALAESSTSRP